MASLYPKKISGKTYWYLREMARVGGRPKMVSERYVGTAAQIEALLDARERQIMPDRTRHLAFGDVAAAWGMLEGLGGGGIIDAAAGRGVAGLPLSPGTYLVLAALNRVVDPCSKRGLVDWWKRTAADRFTKIPAGALDHRRFWDAMHAVSLKDLEQVSQAIALRIVEAYELDCSSVALDMTNFATFIATTNGKAPIAQLGKRYEAITAACGQQPAEMTVVFDAGQNSQDNFTHLAATGLHYVGSVPSSDCPDLTALPASARTMVDQQRFGGLTAFDTRRVTYGAGRRTILTHSPELHESQAAGFDGTTLAKAGKKLDDLAATLARGKTRRGKDRVESEIATLTRKPWVRRVVTWQLSGEQPKDLRLTWGIDPQARTALEEELFGKHVLITDHDHWPAAEVIAASRSQSEAEFSFRQLKDPRVVSFSPMHHWTEHNIRIHTFTCVLALQIAHLMRLKARRAGLHLSVRALLGKLAAIEETVLL